MNFHFLLRAGPLSLLHKTFITHAKLFCAPMINNYLCGSHPSGVSVVAVVVVVCCCCVRDCFIELLRS